MTTIARRDFPLLEDGLTVREALDSIRRRGVGERIVYFYVADGSGRLLGVIPTRRLLTSPLDQPLREIMIRRLVTIPDQATVEQACEQLVMHRLLALPVVDGEGHIVGVIDVEQFTDEVFDLAERAQADAVFEALGFRLNQVRGVSPLRAFRVRFPWLLATITGGALCAMLLGAFQTTLAESLVLTFFLALVLGLGESITVQSMTVAIQALRAARPTVRWYRSALRREVATAPLLGLGCGAVVAAIVILWRGDARAGAAIGLGILASLCSAGFIGLTVPWLFHARGIVPRIAVGPLTLAVTDVFTVVLYLSIAALVL